MLSTSAKDLCGNSAKELRRVFDHFGLLLENAELEAAVARLVSPTYYEPKFSDEEVSILREEAGETAQRYGYTL